MAQNYAVLYPLNRLSRDETLARIIPLLGNLDLRFERRIFSLDQDGIDDSWVFGREMLTVNSIELALKASAQWNGIALEFGTNVGFLSLLLWDGKTQGPNCFALWENSTVFASQKRDPDLRDVFTLIMVRIAKSLAVNCFALVRDPLLKPLILDQLQRTLRDPMAKNSYDIALCGLEIGASRSQTGQPLQTKWNQFELEDFLIFSDPRFASIVF